MQFSYNWLKELSGTKKSSKQLAELLMTRAFEVDEIAQFPHHLEKVVVGQIVKLAKHPNADKLRVANVRVNNKEIIQIVCGAPNAAEGQKVAVALPGTKLSGGIEIKAANLRGIESHGMICSAQELDLGKDESGILVLPKDAPVGQPFPEYLGLADDILEIKILPNRPDALSYEGMTKEISALEGHKPNRAQKTKQVKSFRNNRAPKVTVNDKKGYLRYAGIYFENVTLAESPLWLKAKLMLSGLRPINNVVDIANYVMLLSGQPMHAFDAGKIAGAVTIRRARKNEKLKLLTGEIKNLFSEDLVIADDSRVLALAGVMGGAETAVTKHTKNIFLEIANFDSVAVRRAKARHNLPTDASYRFERGLDPNIIPSAAHQASALIAELTGGKCLGTLDVYPQKLKEWKIKLSLESVQNVLDAKISSSEVVRYLELLGLTAKKIKNGKALEVTVPTARADLRDEEDLIEEVGRMRGYEKIAPSAPVLPLMPAEQNKEKSFERTVKEYLAGSSFDEIITYSFYGEKEIKNALLPLDRHLELENPLSPELRYLRMTLAPAMFHKIRENLRHFDNLNCFEWGSVFEKNSQTGAIGETKTLLLAGRLSQNSKRAEAFYAMKGKVEAFFNALHIEVEKISWIPIGEYSQIPGLAMLHPARSACLVKGNKFIGFAGELHPQVLQAFNLEPNIAIAEFLTEEVRALQKREIIFEPLPKFPFATRDISLTFPAQVTVAEIESLLREAGRPLLKKWELFDIYEKDNEKRLAFHLYFGASDRTLSGEEMDRQFDSIVNSAQKRFGAGLTGIDSILRKKQG